MWQKFLIYMTFWYLDFKITKKTFFVKIEVCGQNVRYCNKSWSCIFIYDWKSDILSIFLNFDEKSVFVYFKSQISKCHIYKKLLPHILRHMHPSGQNDKLMLRCFHYQTPCIWYVSLVLLLPDNWCHTGQQVLIPQGVECFRFYARLHAVCLTQQEYDMLIDQYDAIIW